MTNHTFFVILHVIKKDEVKNMFAYKCIVSYDGSRYNGWQKQGNTSNTIQEKIENVLSRMLDENIEIFGSGRTDAGVHALAQTFHFHCGLHITNEYDVPDFLSAANSFLPKDIRIQSIEECDLRFHARLNAKGKTYCYRIDTSPYGNLFIRNFSHHIPQKLDMDAIKKGADLLIGTHDYKSFCSNKRFKKSSIRTIYTIEIIEKDGIIEILYHGNGFLYNMVRIMTGTLIEIGLGIREVQSIEIALSECNRSFAGHTAPAQGLFLVSVDYE